MLILEAVQISNKDRCESSLLPFAYHRLMYSISNLISDSPPDEGSCLQEGFWLAVGRLLLPELSCRWQSCPSQHAPLPPCQQHKGTAALQLFNAFCVLKRNPWAFSLAIFSWWHYIITQPVSLNQESYLVSKPGGQQVSWATKISKF